MTPTDKLLAAYAAGGLSEEEQRRVEAWLAEDADARAELAELRALIDEARDARPMPTTAPDWNEMARAISDQVEAEPARWWERWWVRPLALSGVAAAAAVALYVALGTGGDGSAPVARATDPDAAPIPAEVDLDVELPGLEQAWNADTIVYDLGPTEEFEGMFAHATADATPDTTDDETEPFIDFRIAPGVYELLDTLDDDELEAVEQHFEGTPS